MKTTPSTFCLLTQWYAPAAISRLQDMSLALRENCENPFIEKIILLNEQVYDLPFESGKITQITAGRRLTFGDAYDYVARHGQQGEAWCLANSDIAFNESLGMASFSAPNEVHCLSRYDRANGSWEIRGGRDTSCADSQDSWLFLTPQITLKCDPFTGLSSHQLEIGRPGYDNKVALLLHVSGFHCKNSCKTIKTYHHHSERDSAQDDAREAHRYPFPYLLLEPVGIDEPARMRLDIMVGVSMPGTNFRGAVRASVPVKPDDHLETLHFQLRGAFRSQV